MWTGAGFSQRVTDTALAAVKGSSRKVYNSRWKGYVEWCDSKSLNPTTAPVAEVLDFLQELADNGRKCDTVKGYLTVISQRHSRIATENGSVRLSELQPVRTWVKGLSVVNPRPRLIVPAWSLDIVLSALKRPPYHPLEGLDLKHLTLRTVFLLAVTSARRVSEIQALRLDTLIWKQSEVIAFVDPSFLPKVHSHWHCNQPIAFPAMAGESDNELKKLCVRECLKAYIEATRPFRGTSQQILLCYGKNCIGKPVSKQRISNWLKDVIKDCYILQGKPVPQHIKGHDVRKQATSWADLAGVDPQRICEAATWQSTNKLSSMFARHYRLDLLGENRSSLGRRVLNLAASSAAESDLGGTRPPTSPQASTSGRQQPRRTCKRPGRGQE